MKILLTGSSGMLGSNINFYAARKFNIYGVYLHKPNPELSEQCRLDLCDSCGVGLLLDAVRPDAIIHCAAFTNVDECESNLGLARSINAAATKGLVTAMRPGTRFIYISTDSVFDGRRGFYSEADSPHPLNNYALTKLEGEEFVKEYCSDYAIIRTNLFGVNRVSGQSFAEWLINNLSSRKNISMFTDVIFSPLSVPSLVGLLTALVQERAYKGIINLGSRGSISKYEFGVYLAKQMGYDPGLIKPISVDNFAFKAKRPKDTSLNTGLASSFFGQMPLLRDEIDRFCQQGKVNGR